LYRGQNEKGIFIAIDDTAALNDIRETGKLLFYDPILSGRFCKAYSQLDYWYPLV